MNMPVLRCLVLPKFQRRLKRFNWVVFSFQLEADSLRSIKWLGVEVIRGIAWPIRDPNWITLAQQIASSRIETKNETAVYDLSFSVAKGALDCNLHAEFQADGMLRAELNMVARDDFDTNRAGFTLLHPVAGVSGTPLTVQHSKREIEKTVFPQLISPDQPATDITGASAQC